MHQLPSTDIPATLQGRNATDDGRQLPRFAPLQTVRCIGGRRFRTQSVRDAGCLFDIDLSVLSWTCCPSPLSYRGSAFVPDFEVVCDTSVEFVAVLEDGERVPDWAIAVAATRGTPILSVPTSELAGVRLENARELLRYANWRVTLSDRVRLMIEQSFSTDALRMSQNAGEPEGVFGMNADGSDPFILVGASLDPTMTLDHEAVHALYNLGLFTPKEWAAQRP